MRAIVFLRCIKWSTANGSYASTCHSTLALIQLQPAQGETSTHPRFPQRHPSSVQLRMPTCSSPDRFSASFLCLCYCSLFSVSYTDFSLSNTMQYTMSSVNVCNFCIRDLFQSSGKLLGSGAVFQFSLEAPTKPQPGAWFRTAS